MKLNNIDVNDILKLGSDLFPMTIDEYLNKDIRGDTFYDTDKYDWFSVTDETFESEEAQNTILGLMCTLENRVSSLPNSLHLAIFEVAKPIRNQGIGTEILDYFITEAIKNKYDYVSLMCHEPSLATYYARFGFKPYTWCGAQFYVLSL